MQHKNVEKSNERNILLNISYDGKIYHGWQIQKNALTVQEVFQNALYRVIGEKVEIKGCSRTESGVHANMYCISFKMIHTIPCERLLAALNRHLPLNISVNKCIIVNAEFHARYSCVGKEYIYKIWNSKIRNPFLDGYYLHYWYKIDEKILNLASKSYIGTHDFTSFCSLDKRNIGNMTRTIKKISVERKEKIILIKIEADGFLYNMVRIIVGTLLSVSQGKIPYDKIYDIIEAKDRSKAGPTAKSHGLYLNKVFYGGKIDVENSV